jgi:hypothetical protein
MDILEHEDDRLLGADPAQIPAHTVGQCPAGAFLLRPQRLVATKAAGLDAEKPGKHRQEIGSFDREQPACPCQ